MTRLDFQLNDFTRISWAPSADVWKERVSSLSQLYQEIERVSVLDGIKPSALQSFDSKGLINVTQWAAHNGLVALPLGMCGQTQNYSSSSIPYIEGRPFQYRVAITRREDIDLWIDAWTNSDDNKIGYLLGYPTCCRTFFKKYWIDEKMVDTTWPMALNSRHNRKTDGTIELGGDPESNILLRWLGIRLVSHLPCDVSCVPTGSIGRSLIQEMKDYGAIEQSEWLWSMLNWPIEWSALHGITEIRTPICKIISRTDATAEKLTVQRHGPMYPAEGASGITFPYTQRGSAPLQLLRPDNWSDNGFKSAEAMSEAHEVVMSVIPFSLREHHQIIDLGCGNGILLEKIHRNYGCYVYGIDSDSSKLEKLLKRVQKASVRCANVFDFDWESDRCHFAIISVNRFKEATEEQRERLIAAIRDGCDFLIAYTYNEATFPLHWEVVDKASLSPYEARLYRVT